MCRLKELLVIVLLCICLAPGSQSNHGEDLTVLIDYEKYQQSVRDHRFQRQINISLPSSKINPLPFPLNFPFNLPFGQQPNFGGVYKERSECEDRECEKPKKVCADPENEVYQECGSKCVLGCRFATTVSSGVTISKHDCDKNDCVEGCFCKTGLVRHQTKCIPASECPVRKCSRYEVYMCGPAAPITCDNALRGSEITKLTKRVECVWGCYCAQGYLRNNYNGKCVPENECRGKAIDISPQIPGLFKHVAPCSGSGCNSGSSEESHHGENNYHHGEHNYHNGEQNHHQPEHSPHQPNGPWNYPWLIPGWNGGGGCSGPNCPWPEHVNHYHTWNDTKEDDLVGPFAGSNITGNCIGYKACAGEYSGINNDGPGSVSSGVPLSTITNDNGTVTVPAGANVSLDTLSTVVRDEVNESDDETYDEMIDRGEMAEHDSVEEEDNSSEDESSEVENSNESLKPDIDKDDDEENSSNNQSEDKPTPLISNTIPNPSLGISNCPGNFQQNQPNQINQQIPPNYFNNPFANPIYQFPNLQNNPNFAPNLQNNPNFAPNGYPNIPFGAPPGVSSPSGVSSLPPVVYPQLFALIPISYLLALTEMWDLFSH